MGQRLVVNIKNGEELLANAYYHWSAYTSAAMEIVSDIINYYKDNKDNFDVNEEIDKRLLAIKMLEETGSGLPDTAIEKALEIYPDIDFKMSENRNAGITEFEEDGMAQNITYAEEMVDINLASETIGFYVLTVDDEDNATYAAKSYMEGLVTEDMKLSDIPHIQELMDMPLEDARDIINAFDNKIDVYNLNDETIQWIIELWKKTLPVVDDIPDFENIHFEEWHKFVHILDHIEGYYYISNNIVYEKIE